MRHGAELNVEQIAGTRFVTTMPGNRVVAVSINCCPSDPWAMQKEAHSLAGFGYDVAYVCNDALAPMAIDDRFHVDALKTPTCRLARQIYFMDRA